MQYVMFPTVLYGVFFLSVFLKLIMINFDLFTWSTTPWEETTTQLSSM